MILLNFSHPFTRKQLAQLEAITGRPILRVINRMPQFNEGQPFEPQLTELLDRIGLTPEQWQTEPVLIVLPALNFIAGALLANLHGRMGYFPHVVRTRPVEGSIPRSFEVAEILDLQAMRAAARRTRTANH